MSKEALPRPTKHRVGLASGGLMMDQCCCVFEKGTVQVFSKLQSMFKLQSLQKLGCMITNTNLIQDKLQCNDIYPFTLASTAQPYCQPLWTLQALGHARFCAKASQLSKLNNYETMTIYLPGSAEQWKLSMNFEKTPKWDKRPLGLVF